MRVSSPPRKIANQPRDYFDTLKGAHRPLTAAEKATAHAEIAARYAAKAKRRREANPLRRLAYFRLHDIENVRDGRTSHAISDWDYLTFAANHIAVTKSNHASKIAAVVVWANSFTPLLPVSKVKRLAKRIIADPCMWSADTLGWRMRLTVDERTAFKVRTIGAMGSSKAERAALRKQKDAEAKRQQRAEKSSGKPRGRPSKGSPWLAEGISRAQWFRNARGDETKTRLQYSTVGTITANSLKSHPAQRAPVAPCPIQPSTVRPEASGSAGHLSVTGATRRAPPPVRPPVRGLLGEAPTAQQSTTGRMHNLATVVNAAWWARPWMERQAGLATVHVP